MLFPLIGSGVRSTKILINKCWYFPLRCTCISCTQKTITSRNVHNCWGLGVSGQGLWERNLWCVVKVQLPYTEQSPLKTNPNNWNGREMNYNLFTMPCKVSELELSSGITLCIEILRAVLFTDDQIGIKTQLTHYVNKDYMSDLCSSLVWFSESLIRNPSCLKSVSYYHGGNLLTIDY